MTNLQKIFQYGMVTSNINGWVREIQRNIHRKTAKYHLLLALTDSIIFINDFLIMVRTYKSINHLPQLQCIPESKCQSQGQKEHQTLPGKN